MKTILVGLIVCCASLAGVASFAEERAASSSSITGRWLTDKQDGVLLIEPQGNQLVGKLVWVKDRDGIKGTERLDSKNPDPALRDRQVLGLVVLTGLSRTPDEDGRYSGRVYNPKSGQTIPIRLELEAPDRIKARVGTSILNKTIRWTRVESNSPDA